MSGKSLDKDSIEMLKNIKKHNWYHLCFFCDTIIIVE
jgi:hypothetical protein